MAVFNAAANQVLAQPVSAFYQGKALRTQQERAELENRALQREEDYAAENRRMAKQDRDRRIAAEDLATQQVKQQIAQGDRDALSYRVNLLAPAINAYTESGDIDAVNEYVNTVVLPNLPEADMREFQEMFGDSLDANEAQAAGLLVDVFRKTDGEYKLQNFTDAEGNIQVTAREGSREWLAAVQNTDLFAAGNVPQDEPDVTNININEAQTSQSAIVYGRGVGDRMVKRDETAEATYVSDQVLNRMSLALARGARAGVGEEYILDVRGFLDTIGVLPLSQEANQTEILSALGNQAALIMRNPESGLGLPGNTSNRDLEFLKKASPGIWKSEEGNKLYIDFQLRQNQFKRDLADRQSDILDANEGLPPPNLEKQLRAFARDYEFYDDEEQAEIESWMETAVDMDASPPPPATITTSLEDGTYQDFIVFEGRMYNHDRTPYRGSPQ